MHYAPLLTGIVSLSSIIEYGGREWVKKDTTENYPTDVVSTELRLDRNEIKFIKPNGEKEETNESS